MLTTRLLLRSLATVFTIVLQVLPAEAQALLDLRDTRELKNRRPLLIAHRGGVITEASPECSRSALRLAAARGYDMVELDIRRSRDGIPIVFHDPTLQKACGRSERVSELTAEALSSIAYHNSTDTILTLKQAITECHQQGLGIMLDLKAGRESPSFLTIIDSMIVSVGLENATISFSGTPEARQHLKHVRFTPTDSEMKQLRQGSIPSMMRQRFWFGLPNQLSGQDIKRLKHAGALIFPAINTFRYPADHHLALAKKDIHRLLNAGVDGFQIDSIYDTFIDRSSQTPTAH